MGSTFGMTILLVTNSEPLILLHLKIEFPDFKLMPRSLPMYFGTAVIIIVFDTAIFPFTHTFITQKS